MPEYPQTACDLNCAELTEWFSTQKQQPETLKKIYNGGMGWYEIWELW